MNQEYLVFVFLAVNLGIVGTSVIIPLLVNFIRKKKSQPSYAKTDPVLILQLLLYIGIVQVLLLIELSATRNTPVVIASVLLLVLFLVIAIRLLATQRPGENYEYKVEFFEILMTKSGLYIKNGEELIPITIAKNFRQFGRARNLRKLKDEKFVAIEYQRTNPHNFNFYFIANGIVTSNSKNYNQHLNPRPPKSGTPFFGFIWRTALLLLAVTFAYAESNDLSMYEQFMEIVNYYLS